jgi:hypothetical protein
LRLVKTKKMKRLALYAARGWFNSADRNQDILEKLENEAGDATEHDSEEDDSTAKNNDRE